jgi:hypothetical protein
MSSVERPVQIKTIKRPKLVNMVSKDGKSNLETKSCAGLCTVIMHRTTTFWSMMDRMYNGGPIRL